MQAARQLKQRVSVEYRNKDLLAVLEDLADEAHLRLDLEPGVLNYLPSNIRDSFTLLMADSTVDQALEAVSGATGLDFKPGKMSIVVSASPALAEGGWRSNRRMSFVMQMAVKGPDGQTYTILFRPDELPSDLVNSIEAQKADVLRKLQAEYGLTATTTQTATTQPK